MKSQNLIHILIGIVCVLVLPRSKPSLRLRTAAILTAIPRKGRAPCFSLSSGGYNTANGFYSLRQSPRALTIQAVGAATLSNNTASQNTATGAGALLSNTTGGSNTANGAFALLSNTIGGNNTATGVSALQANTTGSENTADGLTRLFSNTTGTSTRPPAIERSPTTPPARTIPPSV